MQYHRDAYFEHLFSRDGGREMLVELFGPLVGLPAEWQAQGASASELSLDAFDFDSVELHWLADIAPEGDVTPQVLEDSPAQRVEIDALGRITKLIKGTATIALPQDHPVRAPGDWERLRHFLADHPGRVDHAQTATIARRREAGAIAAVNIPGGYDLPRQLMGDEQACMAFIEEPGLIADMLASAGDLALAMIERISRQCPVDYLHVHEDFAGKSGPLLGPAQFRELIAPYYRRVWDCAREAGARVFAIDSDGNIEPLIEVLMAAGINQIYPNEPAAGMDIVALRERHGGDLILKGGIDKHVLRRDQAAIRRELEYKLQPSLRGGGVVFGLDHRIPNGTPLENYRYYVATARDLLGLPPATPCDDSWVRMAF